MLLRLFRLNDPYRLLGALMFLILASLGFLIDWPAVTLIELKSLVVGQVLNDGKSLYSEVLTTTAPMAGWLYKFIEFLFGQSTTARHILALLILFFQGAFFAILLINNKAQNESTYLPALIFAILCLYSFDMLIVTPELLASTFLLFALNNIFKEVEFRIQRDSTVLNLGVYLGLASLFVLSYAVFLPGTLLLLIMFARISFRKALLLIFGFLLPHVIIITAYVINGNGYRLWSNFYSGTQWIESNQMPLLSMVYLAAIPILYLVLGLIMLNREARLTKYQSQLLQIMFFWLLIAVVEIGVSGNIAPHQVITLAPPLTYFTSHLLLLIRRKWIAEIMLWVFMIGIVATAYLARYEKVPVINYTNLYNNPSPYREQLEGKKVMVIGSDWDIYKNNFPTTSFLDWELSKPVFEQVDNYENILFLDKAFTKSPPDVIIDPLHKMQVVMRRIPWLQKEYQASGDLFNRTKTDSTISAK